MENNSCSSMVFAYECKQGTKYTRGYPSFTRGLGTPIIYYIIVSLTDGDTIPICIYIYIHIYIYTYIYISGRWFGTFFIFPYIGNNHPNWLSYFSEGWPNHQPDVYIYINTLGVSINGGTPQKLVGFFFRGTSHRELRVAPSTLSPLKTAWTPRTPRTPRPLHRRENGGERARPSTLNSEGRAEWWEHRRNPEKHMGNLCQYWTRTHFHIVNGKCGESIYPKEILGKL